jgi:PmbA protein
MLGQDKVRQLLDKVLGFSKADRTEVSYRGGESALTRFANNYIHQNVSENDTHLSVRLVIGEKVGVASTNDLSDDALRQLVERASQAARLQKENPAFAALPSPEPVAQAATFAESTASTTPERRAGGVKTIIEKAEENGLTASGFFSTGLTELAVANSLGVSAYSPYSSADVHALIMGEDSSGYADAAATDVDAINVEKIADEAVDKAIRSKGPIEVPPGEYEVILEEYAVADMLDFLGYLGLGALALQEGRSFMKMGERITGPNITLWDDGLDPRGFPMPFDFEGVPKKRVELITDGFARGVVWDTYTAYREPGRKSTGHALPADEVDRNTYGPMPTNVFLKPGDGSKDQMLRDIKRGLWVTRFHYTNVVHPLLTIITGMTRDGTFLIENGEITKPVKNLRFTQNVLEALASVQSIGRETKAQRGWVGSRVVPALKIGRFNFTSGTLF